MGIGFDETVAGEMFAAIVHAADVQAVHQALGQEAHHTRVAPEGAVANHAAFAVIKVEHRGETQIDTTGAQLRPQDVTASGGGVGGAHGARALACLFVIQPHLAERAHGWQMREAVTLETLHATAFMVDANEQIRAQFFDRMAQARQLFAVLPVARKQNNATHQRVLEALAIGGGQGQTCDVDN